MIIFVECERIDTWVDTKRLRNSDAVLTSTVGKSIAKHSSLSGCVIITVGMDLFFDEFFNFVLNFVTVLGTGILRTTDLHLDPVVTFLVIFVVYCKTVTLIFLFIEVF